MSGEPNLLYEMSMRFKADARPAQLNKLLADAGLYEQLEVKNAVTLRITQTVPFVPDDAAIAKYAEVLANTPPTDDIALVNIRFDGYDYLRPVQPQN